MSNELNTASYQPPAHPVTFAQAVAASLHAYIHTGDEFAYAVQAHVAVILSAFFSPEDIEAYGRLDFDSRQTLMNAVLIPRAARAGLITLDSHGQVREVFSPTLLPALTLVEALDAAPPWTLSSPARVG